MTMLPETVGRSYVYRYGTVSHTALAFGRNARAVDVSAPSNFGGQVWPKRQWSGGKTVPDFVSDKLKLVLWALKSSVRNLMNMDRYKAASLGALVLQSSVLALTIRYSRTKGLDEGEHRYLSSTAVVMSEMVKLVASLYMIFVTAKRTGSQVMWQDLLDMKEAAKTLVPSGIYTFQNNLQFVAVSHLDAATFQVTYQLKILTTAVFSVLCLHRRLDSVRWAALVLLTGGVALVQESCVKRRSFFTFDQLPPSKPACDLEVDVTCVLEEEDDSEGGSAITGLTAVLAMCVSSGFAGVYFEKILKSSSQSLWAKNAQLAVSSVVLGLLAVYIFDSRQLAEGHFFQGYNFLTIFIVLQQASLGLVTALVVKYADNIVKGFASAISIVLTSFISFLFLHDLVLSCSFLIGGAIVMGSVLLYNVDRHPPRENGHIVI